MTFGLVSCYDAVIRTDDPANREACTGFHQGQPFRMHSVALSLFCLPPQLGRVLYPTLGNERLAFR